VLIGTDENQTQTSIPYTGFRNSISEFSVPKIKCIFNNAVTGIVLSSFSLQNQIYKQFLKYSLIHIFLGLCSMTVVIVCESLYISIFSVPV
jgi:hypothetical protein